MSSTPDFDEEKSILKKYIFVDNSIDETVGFMGISRIFDRT